MRLHESAHHKARAKNATFPPLLEDEKDGPSIVSANAVSAIWPRTSARLAGNASNDDEGNFVAIPVTAGPRWTNDEILAAQNHDRRRDAPFDPSFTENGSDCRFAPIQHRVNTRKEHSRRSFHREAPERSALFHGFFFRQRVVRLGPRPATAMAGRLAHGALA